MWKEVRAKATDARDRPHVAQMEQECLTRLRIKAGLEEDPNAVNARPAGRAAAAKGPAYVDSDDEFGDVLG